MPAWHSSLWMVSTEKGNRKMLRLSDPRLHILLSVGVPIVAYMFSRCWNANGGNYYTVPSGYPFCVNFGDVVVVGISLKWVLTAALVVFLFSVYRLWTESRQNLN